jgi:hypothetical protein
MTWKQKQGVNPTQNFFDQYLSVEPSGAMKIAPNRPSDVFRLAVERSLDKSSETGLFCKSVLHDHYTQIPKS